MKIVRQDNPLDDDCLNSAARALTVTSSTGKSSMLLTMMIARALATGNDP